MEGREGHGLKKRKKREIKRKLRSIAYSKSTDANRGGRHISINSSLDSSLQLLYREERRFHLPWASTVTLPPGLIANSVWFNYCIDQLEITTVVPRKTNLICSAVNVVLRKIHLAKHIFP